MNIKFRWSLRGSGILSTEKNLFILNQMVNKNQISSEGEILAMGSDVHC